MKILQVMAGAEHGGAETAFVDMCIAMSEAGQDIEVVTRANDVRVPQLEKAGLKVHALPFRGPLDVYTTWKLSKIIKDFRPHIVQTWMARAAKKTPGWKPSLGDRYLVVGRLGGYYKVKNFRTADYFITITPDIREHLIRGGIVPDRIRHINNFAETEDVVTPVKRGDLGTPEDALVLVMLGRLHDSKAIDVLIKAMSDIPNAYAWIAGEGPLRGDLEKLAADKGVQSRVKFLGWRTDRAALLRESDICVFCSRVEPFGTVFVQAWANRTPVIVSDADGPRQFCRDGEDSLVVPKNDVTALAAAIKRLAGDKSMQQKLIENGERRYKSEFTKEKTLASYLDFYMEILQRENML